MTMKKLSVIIPVYNAEKWVGLSKIWLGRIWSETDLSKSSLSEKYILEGIEIFNKLGISISIPWGLLFLGELYSKLMKKENALENLKKAEQGFKKLGHGYFLARTREALGKL